MSMLAHNDRALISVCADLYAAAFAEDPWNESFDRAALEAYLAAYCDRAGLHFFACLQKNRPIGVALCSIIPSVEGDFARIEDFCIAPADQGRGFGSAFLDEVCAALKNLGCDSALLATQRDFPAHRFYAKNGFVPLDTSVQLFRQF